MFKSTSASVSRTPVNLTQVRYRRIVAYARFPVKQNFRSRPKRKITNLKSAMDLFLGPKNFKGEYHFNKYYYSSTNHVPKYVNPEFDQGNSLIDNYLLSTRERSSRPPTLERQLQPFPDNDKFLTNFQVSYRLKKQIVQDILVNKLSTQELAVKYSLKIPRLEAILRLDAIEKQWKEQVSIICEHGIL